MMTNEDQTQHKETILLVDDEPINLDVTGELLKSLDYQVYLAASGREALAVFMEKKEEIALVILDMVMPGISGSETFDRLRKIDPGVRIIISSGYNLTDQVQQLIERGCNGFLQKPFHLQMISEKVREVLDVPVS
jgi:CheY-like chemotaxis protein